MSERGNRCSKLLGVITAISLMQKSELRNQNCVATLIREAGLVRDERLLYGSDNVFMNPDEHGLWQIPAQLARCLVYLSTRRINSIVEIGTWTGWTASFITAYLWRFNPGLRALTIDVGSEFSCYDHVSRLIPLQRRQTTGAAIAGSKFDLAIIDADHNFYAAMADYYNVGQHARICMLHDINDKYVSGLPSNQGGTPRLWKELQSSMTLRSFTEYLDHSESDSIMGIGLIEKRSRLANVIDQLLHRRDGPCTA